MTGQHTEPSEPAGDRAARLARQVRRRIGRRGAALLAFAFIDYVTAWSLADSQMRALAAATPVYRAVMGVAPLGLWAVLWLAVALICTVQAPMRRDMVGFGAAIGIKVVWAGGMLMAWIQYDVPRAWLLAALWGVLAALVANLSGWPEPRRVE